jgi:hypothetical protein
MGVTETILDGKVKGIGILGSGCAGLAGGNASSHDGFYGSITWKGTYADATHSGKAHFGQTGYFAQFADPVTDGSGNAGYETPDPGSQTSYSRGSFASGLTFDESFLYTSQSSASLNASCNSGRGLKKLSITQGSVTIP